MSGFFPYQATFMLDLVVVALLAVVPILVYGVILARLKKYALHARVMTGLGIVVLVVVVLFEVDMRLHGSIKQIMIDAGREDAYTSGFFTLLCIHIFFSVSTCAIWFWTIYKAIKKFGLKNTQPNEYSSTHKKLAILAIIDIVCVAVTGLMVYYFAFIA
ncbi:MAG: DUF420 domain-containing protein [Planctomycetota bacterium]|nr:MAG: DUF420 domain-containing protein [Planctomycetota bacterium]